MESHWFLPALDQIFPFCPSLLNNVINLLLLLVSFSKEAQSNCISLNLYFHCSFFGSLGYPNHQVLLSHLSNVLKSLPFLFHLELGSWDWLGEDRGEYCEKRLFSLQSLYCVRIECVNWYLIAWFLTLPNLSLQGSHFKYLCWYGAT